MFEKSEGPGLNSRRLVLEVNITVTSTTTIDRPLIIVIIMFIIQSIISERFTASTSVIKCGDLNESILTLKILAKFLGFIESLPFQYREDPHSDKLMEACSKHRQRVIGLSL